MTFSRFYCNSKWLPQIDFNFWGGVKHKTIVWFYQIDATKFQNGHQRSTPKFFVSAKTLKLSQKLFKFYYHIPHNMEMCRWLFLRFYQCTILDQISSVAALSLVKMRESCPTWKSPEGHAHNTNVFICYDNFMTILIFFFFNWQIILLRVYGDNINHYKLTLHWWYLRAGSPYYSILIFTKS